MTKTTKKLKAGINTKKVTIVNMPTNLISNYTALYNIKSAQTWWKGFTKLADFNTSNIATVVKTTTAMIELQPTHKARAKMCENMLYNIVKDFWATKNPEMPFWNKNFEGNLAYYESTKRTREVGYANVMKLKTEIEEDEVETTESLDHNGNTQVETATQHPSLALYAEAINRFRIADDRYKTAKQTMQTNRAIMHTLMDLYKENTAEYEWTPSSDVTGKGTWSVKLDSKGQPNLGKDYVHPLLTKEEERIKEHRGASTANKIADLAFADMNKVLADIAEEAEANFAVDLKAIEAKANGASA